MFGLGLDLDSKIWTFENFFYLTAVFFLTGAMPVRSGESGTSKINFPHSDFDILAIGISHEPYKHPHIKEKLAKFWKFWEAGWSIWRYILI